MHIFNHGELVGWIVLILGATFCIIRPIWREHKAVKRLKSMLESSERKWREK